MSFWRPWLSAVPVIVTPEVGMASDVQEAGCGVVVAGDPVNLGLEMKRLLDDHEPRRYMGKAGRRAVEAKYSWKIIGKQMLDVYADILADRDAALPNSQPQTLRVAS